MSYIDDDVLDEPLDFIDANVENLYICNAEPATFAEASSTYAIGSKASPAITAPENGDASGRKITVSAITDGSVTATDTATHWAITDDTASLLMCAGALASSQAVSNGNTFTLTAFDIEIPDPA